VGAFVYQRVGKRSGQGLRHGEVAQIAAGKQDGARRGEKLG